MKTLKIAAGLGVAGLAVLGVVMARSNPEQAKYEEYAVQRLTDYLKTDFCKKTPGFGLLGKLGTFNCDRFVDSANPQIRELIASTTERQNYLIFSVYRTEIKLDSLIPGYKFETVGAFDNFYTYTAEEK
jgi:hypothetical protein